MAFAQIVTDIANELQRAEPEIRHLITELSWPQHGHHGHHRRNHGCRKRCSKRDFFCQENSCPQKSPSTDYKASLDVKNYSSDEISVKVVDNFVVVEGNQPEKEDDFGTISRNFVRRYRIPEEFNIEEASSSLSQDGILSIKVPLKVTQSKERVIPIQRTGKLHQDDTQPLIAKETPETKSDSPEKTKDDSSDFEMVKDNLD